MVDFSEVVGGLIFFGRGVVVCLGLSPCRCEIDKGGYESRPFTFSWKGDRTWVSWCWYFGVNAYARWVWYRRVWVLLDRGVVRPGTSYGPGRVDIRRFWSGRMPHLLVLSWGFVDCKPRGRLIDEVVIWVRFRDRLLALVLLLRHLGVVAVVVVEIVVS